MCSPRSPGANTDHHHQHSSERSCTATTRTSTASVQSRENSEHGRLAQLWLRSTAVERRGRSLPHRPRTRRRRVFDRLVEQAACRGLLDLTYSIDSTDVRTMPADQDASKGYDQPPKSTTTATAVRSSRPGKRSRLPRSSPRASKRQRRRRCASRVTRSPSKTDLDAWRQRLRHARLARPPAGRRGRASRSVQRTKHRRSERHRVQGRSPHRRTQRGRSAEAIDAGRDVQPPGGVERTNDAVKDCGLGHVRARGRVHARAQVFLALCLRLVIAITNDERGDNPGSTVITL